MRSQVLVISAAAGGAALLGTAFFVYAWKRRQMRLTASIEFYQLPQATI